MDNLKYRAIEQENNRTLSNDCLEPLIRTGYTVRGVYNIESSTGSSEVHHERNIIIV